MSWSEIVQKNIKFHDEIDLMEKDSYIRIQHENALNHINSVFHINERNISPVIQESCNGYFKEDSNPKYFRKRSVPSKKQKNYPVKQKKDVQYDIKEKKLESYNIINDYGNKANFDYVNWKEKIVESQEDDFDEGILGALLVNEDNTLSITFLDNEKMDYVIEPYEIPKEGIEPYVWIPPVEYIEPEIKYDIIWKRLDYEFYKYERPYIYNSPLEGGPNIKFFSLSSL
tara:strand:- start:105 stop:788 length:684 start_codon:yes stop_codon:yes gene_type:complete